MITIHKTLVFATKVEKEDTELAVYFSKNPVLPKFYLLNAEMEKRKQDDRLAIYTPIDCQAYLYSASSDNAEKQEWSTSNPRRVASQILTGVENFEILALFEKMRDFKVEMLPISLHPGGFSILAKPEKVGADLKLLAEEASKDLQKLGLRPVQLELTQYGQDSFATIDRVPAWIQKVIDGSETQL